jgi:hypothetical protein
MYNPFTDERRMPMFGSSILEVAVGVIFVYLVLSLICTAVNEAIATTINKRGKTLFGGIKNLLNDPTFTGLAQQVYNHGLVDGVSQDAAARDKTPREPSYLAPKTFSLALLDVLGANGVVSAAHGTALTLAEQADDAYEQAKQAAAADKSNNPKLKAEVETKEDEAQKARAKLVEAVSVAEETFAGMANSVVTEADTALVQAKDAYETSKAKYKKAETDATPTPTDEQRAELERARTDFERARTAFFDAAQAAANKPGDEQPSPIVKAKEAFDTATAAVKILDARRAAVASARDSKDLELRTQAANTLEQALVIGRKLFTDVEDKLAHIQVAVNRLPEGHTKESLLVLIDKTRRDIAAGGNALEKFRENVEEWFNHAMDRVTGWYKRWTQRVQVVLAMVVVVLLNADTIMLIQRFSTDKDVRAAVVALAEKTGQQNLSQLDAAKLQSELKPVGIPLGWTDDTRDTRRLPWKDPEGNIFLHILVKLLGLLLTVGAVSLGAPFWFDTLNKFINLRGAGTPPGEPQKSAPTT